MLLLVHSKKKTLQRKWGLFVFELALSGGVATPQARGEGLYSLLGGHCSAPNLFFALVGKPSWRAGPQLGQGFSDTGKPGAPVPSLERLSQHRGTWLQMSLSAS